MYEWVKTSDHQVGLLDLRLLHSLRGWGLQTRDQSEGPCEGAQVDGLCNPKVRKQTRKGEHLRLCPDEVRFDLPRDTPPRTRICFLWHICRGLFPGSGKHSPRSGHGLKRSRWQDRRSGGVRKVPVCAQVTGSPGGGGAGRGAGWGAAHRQPERVFPRRSESFAEPRRDGKLMRAILESGRSLECHVSALN